MIWRCSLVPWLCFLYFLLCLFSELLFSWCQDSWKFCVRKFLDFTFLWPKSPYFFHPILNAWYSSSKLFWWWGLPLQLLFKYPHFSFPELPVWIFFIDSTFFSSLFFLGGGGAGWGRETEVFSETEDAVKCGFLASKLMVFCPRRCWADLSTLATSSFPGWAAMLPWPGCYKASRWSEGNAFSNRPAHWCHWDLRWVREAPTKAH